MTIRTHMFQAVLGFALAHCPAVAAVAQKAASTPAVQEPARAPAVKLAAPEAEPGRASMKLVLLKPSMRYEHLPAGARVSILEIPEMPSSSENRSIQGFEWAAYERHLLDAARKAVGSKATVLEMDSLAPPAAEACKPLDRLASRLARGDMNEEALGGLARLAALDERYAVLVQFLRLKTGPGRSWNPYTGGIASSTDSTLIQAALVSGKGSVIWKGERLVRNKALKPTDSAFIKELALLYRDFDIK